MVGIDTNLLVRLLTNDDPGQAQFAAHLIENNPIFIPKSVLLETQWVLRYSYELNAQTIIAAFKKLLGLSQITVEDPLAVAKALQWYEAEFDFAHALHLASSKPAKKFATLDKKLVKQAKKFHMDLITQ